MFIYTYPNDGKRASSEYATNFCSELTHMGASKWRVPYKDELDYFFFKNEHTFGSFRYEYKWMFPKNMPTNGFKYWSNRYVKEGYIEDEGLGKGIIRWAFKRLGEATLGEKNFFCISDV